MTFQVHSWLSMYERCMAIHVRCMAIHERTMHDHSCTMHGHSCTMHGHSCTMHGHSCTMHGYMLEVAAERCGVYCPSKRRWLLAKPTRQARQEPWGTYAHAHARTHAKSSICANTRPQTSAPGSAPGPPICVRTVKENMCTASVHAMSA